MTGRLAQLTKNWTEHLNTLLKQASNGADVANDIGLATQILTDLRIRTAELANV